MLIKKLISLSLVFVLLIMSSPFLSFGATTDFSAEYLVKDKSSDTYLEVVKENGFKYIFLKNKNQIKTITLDKNNKIIEAYVRDLQQKDSYYKIKINKDNEGSLGISSDLNYNAILSDIDTEEKETVSLPLEYHNNDFSDGGMVTAAATYADFASAVKKEAIKVYGSIVFSDLISSGSYYGRTGYVYYSRSYSASKTITFSVAAGLSLSAISLLLGLPYAGVKGLVTLAVSGGGVLVSAMLQSVQQWSVKVDNEKEVKVGSLYPYRTYKQIFGDVFARETSTGSIVTLPFEYDRTEYWGSYYNDNQALIKYGISVYNGLNP